MSIEHSEAVVLKVIPFGDSSRIVTFLTPGRGRLTAIAKGADRRQNAFTGALTIPNLLDISYSWKVDRDVQTLTEAKLVSAFPGRVRNLDASTWIAFPLEITLRLAQVNEPSSALFAVLVNGLENLANTDANPRITCLRLALQVLTAAGFGPTLDTCCHCGKPCGESLAFDYSGGVSCAACPADITLTGLQRRFFHEDSGSFQAPPWLASDLLETLYRYATRQIDGDLRSVHVLRELRESGAGVR